MSAAGGDLARASHGQPGRRVDQQPRAAVHFDGTDPPSRCYEVGPGTDPIGWVGVREPFTVSTLDASGGQLRPGADADSIDLARIFPVTGPIGIDGVRAGDAVGIEILDLRLAPEAYCWTRPGLGLLGGEDYLVKRVETGAPRWHYAGNPASGVPLSLDPHVGTVGLAPAEAYQARDLGPHGGNLDVRALGGGATLWLVAQVDGGSLYLGDVHAGIGDGEVCGTGLEAAADLTVQVHRRVGWTPVLPTISAGSRHWVVGVAESVEQAIATIVPAMTGIVAPALSMTLAEARLLVSQLLILRICQVVNPRVSVAASLQGGLDTYLGPPAAGPPAPATARGNAPGGQEK
jgi:amidase